MILPHPPHLFWHSGAGLAAQRAKLADEHQLRGLHLALGAAGQGGGGGPGAGRGHSPVLLLQERNQALIAGGSEGAGHVYGLGGAAVPLQAQLERGDAGRLRGRGREEATCVHASIGDAVAAAARCSGVGPEPGPAGIRKGACLQSQEGRGQGLCGGSEEARGNARFVQQEGRTDLGAAGLTVCMWVVWGGLGGLWGAAARVVGGAVGGANREAAAMMGAV